MNYKAENFQLITKLLTKIPRNGTGWSTQCNDANDFSWLYIDNEAGNPIKIRFWLKKPINNKGVQELFIIGLDDSNSTAIILSRLLTYREVKREESIIEDYGNNSDLNQEKLYELINQIPNMN